MANKGTANHRGLARILNLPDPLSAREPALARDSCYRPRSGKLISTAVVATPTTTSNTSANACRAWIWENGSTVTVNSITTDVATATLNAFYRVGLYRCNNLLYPTSLVFDGASDESAGAGLKPRTLPVPIEIAAGTYIAVLKANASISMRSIPASAIPTALGYNNAAGFAAITSIVYPVAWAANIPWPATFPVGLAPTVQTNFAVPFLGMLTA